MELKDVVLSTLAEMEDNEQIREDLNESIKKNFHKEPLIPQSEITQIEIEETLKEEANESSSESSNDELHFLTSVRERLLVLFEGFQAPNNKEIEAKIDMTLNFLEYTLATIDKRVEKLQKGDI